MVYCVAFGCNSNSFSSENISFFRLSAGAVHAVEKRKKIKCFHYYNYYYYN